MRHALRVGTLLALLALLVVAAVVAAPPSNGQEARPRQAWARTGALGPLGPAEGRIYVSQAGGQEQARAFAQVSVPAGAIAPAAELQLREAQDGNLAAPDAEVVACALADQLAADGEVTADPPAADCAVQASLTRAEDGTWTLPLALFVDRPLPGQIGVVLLPVPDGAAPAFTVAFDVIETTVTGFTAPPTAAPVRPEPALDPAPMPMLDSEPSLAPTLEDPAAFQPPSAVRPEVPAAERAPSPATAPTLSPRGVADIGGPPTFVVLVPVALAATYFVARRRWRPDPLFREFAVPGRQIGSAAGTFTLVIAAMSFSESAAYKFGFVAIVFIAVLGLHLLVNWAGELSLAHASFIGLPAFAVAQLTHHTGWTPFAFVPVGIAVGALLGLLVAVPALRTRGLQVALVTLAFGIAVTQFAFVRTWVIGPPSGLNIPVPSLFGVEFRTNRSMVPILAAVVLAALLAARGILDSKVGRAMAQLRSDPDAAATTGVPVARYRAAAYGLAGAFAGLAGGCYVFWVQRVGPQAFPLNLGFSYLIIATLAGKGGLAGVAISVFLLEGGRLFDVIPPSVALYLGPIALIYNVTRYQEGINGLLRQAARRLREVDMLTRLRQTTASAVRLQAAVGFVVVIAGFSSILLAWYHAGNTDELWIQNQELLSGGIGGGGLIVFGSALLIRDALLNGAATVRRSDESFETEGA